MTINYMSSIMELLKNAKYKKSSEEIQTALGKYELSLTLKNGMAKIKREWL